MAIGELQWRLGPDQRATASADILDATNNPYTLVWHSDSGKGWDNATSDWTDDGSINDFALPFVSVDPSRITTLLGNSGEFDEAQLDNPVELIKVANPSNGSLASRKG